ncbi:hypothetical protein GCM10027347_12900 [Larkinella harenae]
MKKYTALLGFFLVMLISCRKNDPTPDGYIKDLMLGLEPLSTGVKLTWNPVIIFEEGMYGGPPPVPPTQYEIYISETGENNLKKLAVVDGTTKEFLVQNVASGQPVYAKVIARHPKLNSGPSNVATTNAGQLKTTTLVFPSNPPYITYGAWGGTNLVYKGQAGTEIRLADGTTRKLNNSASTPVLSPDGKYVAYTGGRNHNTSYTTQLFIEEIETGLVRLVDTDSQMMAAEWSNDGKRLAYVTGRGLSVFSLADGRIRWLTGSTSISFPQIDWSHDNSYIVFVQPLETAHSERYVTNLMRVPANGGQIEPVTSSLYSDQQPAFSPNGEQLAFISTRSGYQAVWVLTLKTNRLEQLTNGKESFAYTSRLDWNATNQITFSGLVSLPGSGTDTSLKKIVMP